jgi:predicted enzyme involved in methoxymalonyl-ACP biosynthesis
MSPKANNEIRAIAQSSSLGRNAHVFDDDDVLQLLRTAIEQEGSQRLFVPRYDIDRSDLNTTLNGRR